MNLKDILTEAADLDHETAATPKLAGFIKAIAAHLLGTLPAAEQTEIHEVATDVEQAASVVADTTK